MPKMPTKKFRGLWVLVALAAAVLCSASGALAQRRRATHNVTDADVDAMIKQLVDRLFSLQQKQWVITVYDRKPRKKEHRSTVPKKTFTGELIANREGRVEFRPTTGKKLRVPGKFVVKLSPPAKRGGSYALTYRTRKKRAGEPLDKVPTKVVAGKLIKHVKAAWIFKTEDGKKRAIPKSLTVELHGPGHFSGRAHGGSCTSGASALATLALLKAGMPASNARMKLALQYLRGHELQAWHHSAYATYSVSLRANVWEHLIETGGDSGNRSGYRTLLREDAQYLEDGIGDTGGYNYHTSYNADGTPRKKHGCDQSNTQFGVLGMWAAASARLEIDKKYWNLVNNHWLKTQAPNGSWGYKVGSKRGSSTMTTAGLNSLYLVLDLYHSRKQGAYVRFNGIRPNAKSAVAVKRVFAAIEKALGWMKAKDRGHGNPYYRYGLERLGVASGLKRIGGRDWYRLGVEYLYRSRASLNKISAVNGSFLLMFLAYGRAPIIFNKLRTPGDPEWNYYFRDLHYMCRFLTRNFERIHKWQVVSLEENAEEDLGDAPITYLAGIKKPTYTAEQLAKLKNYLENGGTLVLHATRRSSAFVKSIKEVFEDLFKDRGYEFAKLANDHPVYNVHYGRGRALNGMDLEGMSDGARTFIFLMPKDIAGAWQQNLELSNRDLFELMANLRIYAAPGYFDLPSRLRLLKPIGNPVAAKGVLRVARIEHAGHWNANPTVWSVRGKFMTHETGLTVTLAEKPITLKNADELANVDLLQLLGHGDFKLTADQIKVLADWLKSGGMLLMDAAGGQKKFAAAADKLFDELMRTTGGRAEMVGAADKLITGEFPGGQSAGSVSYNRWGLAKSPGGGAPNLKTIKIGSRDAVLYSPIDLSATANGHFIYKMPAYKPGFARKLMDNIALLRWSQKHPAPAGEAK